MSQGNVSRRAATLPTETEIFAKESSEIRTRRAAAGVATTPATPPDTVEQDLIGVSLSGGGIRAASVGLGFMQALYERGILRYVDYMSTVSGGTYVGAFITSLLNDDSARLEQLQPPRAATAAAANNHDGHRLESASGRQPVCVQRLINAGNYLHQFAAFINGYLIGFLAINVVVWSGLISLCALLAWCFRSLDYVEVQHLVSALGFRGDIPRAFVPTTFLFIAWVIAWMGTYFVATYWSNRTPRFVLARGLLTATIASAALAIGVLVATGDISDGILKEDFGIEMAPESKQSLQKFFEYLLYGVILTSILPYFTFWRLMKSGRGDAPPSNRAIFFIATRALLWGVPLVIFTFFATENISRQNRIVMDEGRLTASHISDWKKFGYRVKQYAHDVPSPHDYLPAQPSSGDSNDKPGLTEYAAFLREPNQFLWERTRHRAAAALPADNLPATQPSNKSVAVTKPHLLLVAYPFLQKLIPRDTRQWLYQHVIVALFGPSPSVLESHPLLALAQNKQNKERHEAKHWFYERWASAVYGIFDWNVETKFRKLLKDNLLLDRDEQELTFRINEQVLNDVAYFDAFMNAPRAPDELVAGNLQPQMAKFRGMAPQLAQVKQLVNIANRTVQNGKTFQQWQQAMTDLRRQELDARLADDPTALNAARLQIAALARSPVMDDNGYQASAGTLDHASLDKYVRRVNYELFSTFHGAELVHPLELTFARNVLESDQRVRWHWFLGAGLVFLISGLTVNLNAVSLFTFYRDQLAKMWLIDPRANRPLSQLQNCEHCGPYHLINATISYLPQSEERFQREQQNNWESSGHFLLSKLFCGCGRLGFMRTDQYDEHLDLATATAISGAALAPTVSHNFVVQAILFLFNFRLGQWLPNPNDVRDSLKRTWSSIICARPTPLHLLRNQLFYPRLKQDLCFLSDGGVYDNLGIESLILRRCRLMIALDASADPAGQFENLVQVLRRLEDKRGIRIEDLGGNVRLGLEELTPRGRDAMDASTASRAANGSAGDPSFAFEGRLTEKHYAVWRVLYPDRATNEPSWLIYVKSSLNGDEPEQLLRYMRGNEQFPHDSTLDQFFDAAKFEAYRDLGYHLGQHLADKEFDWTLPNPAQRKHKDPPDHSRQLCEWFEDEEPHEFSARSKQRTAQVASSFFSEEAFMEELEFLKPDIDPQRQVRAAMKIRDMVKLAGINAALRARIVKQIADAGASMREDEDIVVGALGDAVEYLEGPRRRRQQSTSKRHYTRPNTRR